jgi:hypothetical protein
MPLDLISYSDMRQLQVPEQLFSYADAYRSSAAVLCRQMKKDASSRTWPNGAVVLVLAAHAVELFLKGALIKRIPAKKVCAYQHNLDKLSEKYHSQFPESKFKWDIPFASRLTAAEWTKQVREFIPSLTGAEIKRLRDATPAPSILYRYPVDKRGWEWHGLYGFEPHSFLVLLDKVKKDFKRIKSHLA